MKRRLALGTAAIALAVGIWWASRSEETTPTDTANAPTPRRPIEPGSSRRERRQSQSERAIHETAPAPDPGPSTRAELGKPERIRSRRSTLIEVLSREMSPPRPQFEFIPSADEFFRTVQSEGAGGPWVDLADYQPGQSTARISIPAGVSTLDPSALFSAEPGRVLDVAISGSGMDESLLYLTGPFEFRQSGSSLALEGLTVHCNNQCLAADGSPLLVTLSKCRVIGFDSGDLGAQLVRGTSVALAARDSVIASGFGRAPGVAYLANVSPGTSASSRVSILSFERCRFDGVFRPKPPLPSFFKFGRGISCQFEACQFSAVLNGDRVLIESPAENTRFVDCVVDRYVEEPDGVSRRVAELNPAWTEPEKR